MTTSCQSIALGDILCAYLLQLPTVPSIKPDKSHLLQWSSQKASLSLLYLLIHVLSHLFASTLKNSLNKA